MVLFNKKDMVDFSTTTTMSALRPGSKFKLAEGLNKNTLDNIMRYMVSGGLQTSSYLSYFELVNGVKTKTIDYLDFVNAHDLKGYEIKLNHFECKDIEINEDDVLLYEMASEEKFTQEERDQFESSLFKIYNDEAINSIVKELRKFYPDVTDEEWEVSKWV